MKRIALALLKHLRTRLPGTLLAFIPLALAAALFLPLPASAAGKLIRFVPGRGKPTRRERRAGRDEA